MTSSVQLLGYGSAVLTTCSFYPQAIKTLRTNETRGISLRMYLLFTLGITGWGIYGYVNRDWPVFVANLVTFPASAAILERKLQAQWALSRQRQHQGK